MPIQANANGRVTGTFDIPANTIPAGIKEVVFRGAGGSRGSALYAAEGTEVTRVLQQNTVTLVMRTDPLAQTFTLAEPRIIGAVEFKFCAKGANNKPVYVQIRETEVGIPNQTILGESVIQPSAFVVNPIVANPPSIPTQWTRATFPIPIPLEANKEYAIVVLTDDADHAIAVCKLGSYVQAGNGNEGYVTSQPYTIGVLLSSSNASTWTPHQDMDLAFQLLACRFTSNSTTINYGNAVPENGVTDFQVLANVLRPSGDTDVVFTVTEATSAAVHSAGEAQPIQLLERVVDTFQLRALLSGTPTMSPILFQGTQVLFGNMGLTGTYFTRAIEAALSFDATIRFEVFRPGSSTTQVHMEHQSSVDGVDTIVGGVYQTTWSAATLDERKRLADGWYEESYTVNDRRGVGLDRVTRCRITLGGSPRFRPKIRNLRVILK